MQDGQTEEEGALQQTCLLSLFNMSTVSKSSNKAQQQHISTCCLQLLGPGAVADPFRGRSVADLPNSVADLVIHILTPKIKRQEETLTCLTQTGESSS